MRTTEAEILQIMENFQVDRPTAKQKLQRMVEWATHYKKFVETVKAEEEVENSRINLWDN